MGIAAPTTVASSAASAVPVRTPAVTIGAGWATGRGTSCDSTAFTAVRAANPVPDQPTRRTVAATASRCRGPGLLLAAAPRAGTACWRGGPARGCGRRAGAARAADEHGQALGARERHVETVGTVQELEPTGDFVGVGSRHRVDHDRRLLSLEPVHGSHARARRQRRGEARHVRVVGRDHEHVRQLERPVRPAASVHGRPTRSATMRATAPTSSAETVRLPTCSTGTKRTPAPPSGARTPDHLSGAGRV